MTTGQAWHRRKGAGIAALALGVSMVVPMAAHARPASLSFAIPAGPLAPALVRYAAVTGVQLLYTADAVGGKRARAVTGRYAPDAALTRLLAGTGLQARDAGTGVVVLEPMTTLGDPRPTGPRPTQPMPIRALAPTAGTYSGNRPPVSIAQDPADPIISSNAPADVPNEIIVTGTHIRGANPGAPPVTTITRDDLDRQGYATVAQALQALPATFGGTATEQSALAFADRSSSNATFATGVDLRGLGAGATLVLVNGRRVAGTGSEGAFADVSAIPTGAVDRVEVLLDGASAVYGSDAVGGVVNIILKKPFDGVESRVRLGSVTSGSKRDVQVDQTVGKQWGTGGVMLSYEYDRQGALPTKDRGFAASADSRPYGGTDHRYYFSLPGNVLGSDPVTGAFGPTYAIPGGQNGTSLTPASFLPGVTNLENFREGVDLIPRQTRHSVYATLTQDLGDSLHFTADARYSHRAFSADTLGSATIFDVTDANPYFVSPDGATSDLIAYSFGQELGPERAHGTDAALAVSGGLDADLGRDWKLRSYAAFSQEKEYTRTDNLENDALLSEALGTTLNDPSTGFSTAVDGFFNPYGDGHANSAAILSFIGGGYTYGTVRTQVLTGHVDADGTLFSLPAGAVKIAIGGDIRRESFRSGGEDFYATTTPVAEERVSGSRVIEAAFAELHAPLVGPGMDVPLVRRLDLSAAARVEHYADFGTTTNPKVGLTWVPIEGVSLRGDYGTSFRAPSLRELKSRQTLSTTSLPLADGSSTTVIQLSGGNPSLKPETAKSWTAGADIHPKIIPGLTLSGSWFRTAFTRRVGSPVNEDFDNALIDPALAPFVSFVSPATNAADLARVTALLSNPSFSGGSSLPATSVGAIVDSRYVNTGSITVSGIDLTAGYTIKAGTSRIDLSANGTYLLTYRERVTPTAPPIDHRNLPGYPVALRGRASVGWSRGPLNALVAANGVGHYRDLSGNRIKGWTTCDLQLGYKPGGDHGWAQGIELSLAVQNLFNRSPPFYDSFVGAGYDAANADALKRFVSLQLTKRW